MVKMLGQLTDQDKIDYAQKIGQCIDHQNLLCRKPVGQYSSQEQIDNYQGVLAGCKAVGNTDIPKRFIKALFRYFGFLNNVNPGKIEISSWMPRFPQLIACMFASAFPKWNPLHIFLRSLVCVPFFISAIIIALSCKGTDKNNTDARILGWLLIQNTKDVSLLCNLASKIWLKRLENDYGKDGMKAVAAIYFQTGHPFIENWCSK